MANMKIIPPRVDFLDAHTGKISREWFLFFYNWMNETNSDADAAAVLPAGPWQLPGTIPNSFIDNDRTPFTNPDVIPRPFVDENVAAFVMDFTARMEASLAQMRQQINDTQSLVEFAPVAAESVSTGGSATIDCVNLEAIGYWQPVTDGASNIIYADGNVVVAFTCTS